MLWVTNSGLRGSVFSRPKAVGDVESLLACSKSHHAAIGGQASTIECQGDSVLRLVPVFRVAARADRDSDPSWESTRRESRMDSTATQTISLWDALASVPDHRRPAGKRYPLASLLLIALAAMLAGRRDQLGIVRWGRRLKRETLTAIGIDRDRVPAPSVWCELFQALDVGALERAFGGWVAGEAAVSGHVAIDGKRLRGSATATAPGTHLLAAFSASLQGVIGQLRVAPETNEITAALELLKTLPLKGVTITGDAIFTQRAICQAIIDGGGDYFFTVKGNQPALKADIEQAFRPFSPLGGMVSAA